MDENDEKVFKYANQLSNLAHREQIAIHIELDDVRVYFDNPDNDLASAIKENARRFSIMFSDAIYEKLPDYRSGIVTAKDSLDVFIELRKYLQTQNADNNEGQVNPDARNKLPMEIMKRL